MPKVKQDLSEISVEPEYTAEDLEAEEPEDGDEDAEIEEDATGDGNDDDNDDDAQDEEQNEDSAKSAKAEAFQAKLAKYRTGGDKLAAGGDAPGGISFGASVFLNRKNKRTLSELEVEKKNAAAAALSGEVLPEKKEKKKRKFKKGIL